MEAARDQVTGVRPEPDWPVRLFDRRHARARAGRSSTELRDEGRIAEVRESGLLGRMWCGDSTKSSNADRWGAIGHVSVHPNQGDVCERVSPTDLLQQL
jgi:hypothetical protein